MADTPQVETQALTDWVNEPTILDLKQNITDAKSATDEYTANVSRWLDARNITGSAKIAKITGSSNVQPRLIRKQNEWRYSSLSEPFLSTSDLFNVRPVTAGDRNRAKQNELVLNNQINTKLDKIKFIDAYIRDAVDTGSVIVKVGWETEESEIEVEVPTYEFVPDETGQAPQHYTTLIQMQQQDPEAYADRSTPGLDQALQLFLETGEALLPKQIGTEIQTKKIESKNQPCWEIIDSNNLIVDPSCNGDFKKASFIAEAFKTSLANLQKDGKYTNLTKIDIEAASPVASADYVDPGDSSFNFADKSRKQFVVYEYWGLWDIKNNGVLVPIVAAWVGDTLIRLEENRFPDKKHPFVIAVYMPVRKSVFGEPDAELLEDNQKIIGAVTRGMVDLLGKSANSQTGFRRDFLDAANKRKFNRGEDYEFNAGVDPRMGVFTHVYPEIPASAMTMLTLQNNEAESLTGIKAFSRGISGAALGNTATAVRSALDATSKRELGILRRLASGIIEIGRKFISMNAVFLSEEEVIRITDEEFIQVRRDDLAGNFDLQLSISTAEEDNQKAEELAYMLQTIGNNMDQGMTNMILSDIARLRKMPDLAKKIEQYQPEPNPMLEMKMQLEIELLKAQIAKEQSLTMHHSATAELEGARGVKETTQAQLNLVKSGTEKAKARHLGSQADVQDLNYLEQESGVHQERDLQKIDRHHEHNVKEKAVDAYLAKPQVIGE